MTLHTEKYLRYHRRLISWRNTWEIPEYPPCLLANCIFVVNVKNRNGQKCFSAAKNPEYDERLDPSHYFSICYQLVWHLQKRIISTQCNVLQCARPHQFEIFAFHKMNIIHKRQKMARSLKMWAFTLFFIGHLSTLQLKKVKVLIFSPKCKIHIPPFELSRSALVSDQTIIEISSASKHSINEKCNIMKSSLPANNLMVHLNFAVLVPNSSSNSRNSRFGWRLQSNFQINSQFDLKWLAGVRALVQLLLFLFPTFISRKPS